MIQLDRLGYFLPQGHLFANVNLQINKGDKVGLVGKNGAGKSTLLRILSGKIPATDGQIHHPKNLKFGFLTQDIHIDVQKSVYDFLFYSNELLNGIRHRLDEINEQLTTRTDYETKSYLALLDELTELNHSFNVHDGYQWEEKIKATLEGLGFSEQDQQKNIAQCSGGWKMRAELARILVNQPDILLLDEPTNHLDILSISWLETYLQRFDGAVILISHDRLFLDNVSTRTLEISRQQIFDFPYPYTKYKELRAEELERLEQAKKQQDKDIKHAEELIEKFRAKKNKAAFAQSLIKKLEKTDRIEVEKDQVARLKLRFPLAVQPGKWVLELSQVGKSYDERQLFKNVSITIGRGEKIALLGPNGVGKSTLLKAIMGTIEHEGTVALGHNVSISYFAQDQAEKLDPKLSIFETVDQIAKGDLRKDLRSILGAFLFSGEDVDKKVSVLSGGERTRLALCCLLLSPSNFLILDEPTNHLDLQSKEVLKEALLHYEGTFIIVSHDREFVDGLSNRIWDIEKENILIHHFNLQEYLDYKLQKSPSAGSEKIKENQPQETKKQVSSETTTAAVVKPKLDKAKQKLEREISNLEQQIEQQERLITDIENELGELDYENKQQYNLVLNRYETEKTNLEALYHKWELKQNELTEA
jgi:ATP-binding cassette subfamily F protein 3